MRVSLKAMQYFVTAVCHGSIARAAGELNIAASAVAAAIDQIEAEFGMTLVTRHRARGVQPTAGGKTLLTRFERLLDEYHTVMQDGADLRDALSGPLRIGYYAPVAPAFLPRILSDFVDTPDTVSLQIEECDNTAAQTGLLDGAYDAILFVSNDARPAIGHDVLIEAPAFCLLPAAHPLSTVPDLSMAQIAAEPLVVLNRPFAGGYYRALLQRHGADASIAAEANTTEMVRALVGAGQGVAILNMLPLTDVTYGGDAVVARPIRDPLPPLSLAVGYDKARPRRIVQAFADACRTYFRAEGGRCIVR